MNKGYALTRILIVDDHEMLRDAVTTALRRLGTEFQVFGVANGEQALDWIKRHGHPHLVLLDIEIPGSDGIAVLRAIRQQHGDIKVAMLSGRDDPETIQNALRAGALGFIGKTSGTDALVSKVRELLRGVRVVSSSQAGWPLDGHASNSNGETKGLTRMQLAVLEYLIGGLKNREIADELKIAEGTVKAHSYAIYKALNVSTRAQLQVWARRTGK